MAHKNTGLFAETFDFTLLWRCLVYLLLSSQSRMGPKPTADQKVNILWNYFTIERAEWKQIVSMSELKKAKQENRERKIKLKVWVCNEAKIIVTSAMKQILLLRVQWSKYYCYECNEANISVTSAIKQIIVLRVQ